MRTEISERWVRGRLDGQLVIDSHDPLLFWEDGVPVPHYAYRPDDVAAELRPSTGEPPTQPWFALPHSPVRVWYDLVLADRTLSHAAWALADPALAGRVVVSWQDDLIDWTEEDEPVRSHPRDPHHRVDALPSSRHVVVSLDGVPLAESDQPVLLFETGLPTRYYLPVADANADLLTSSATTSHCPYKGIADRYWNAVDGPANLAWGYTDPFPAVAAIAGRICFYNELVDLTVDGFALPRPTSPFSAPAHRPS